MWFFLALVIDGMLAGAIYALIALAFVLVYKASRMINFALGEWVMFGAMLSGMGVNALGLGTVGALVFAGIGMMALAIGFCRLVLRRLLAPGEGGSGCVGIFDLNGRGDSPLEGGGFEPSVPREGELHRRPFSSNSKSGQTTIQPADLAKVLRGP